MSFFVKPHVGSAFNILNGHKLGIKSLPDTNVYFFFPENPTKSNISLNGSSM